MTNVATFRLADIFTFSAHKLIRKEILAERRFLKELSPQDGCESVAVIADNNIGVGDDLRDRTGAVRLRSEDGIDNGYGVLIPMPSRLVWRDSVFPVARSGLRAAYMLSTLLVSPSRAIVSQATT